MVVSDRYSAIAGADLSVRVARRRHRLVCLMCAMRVGVGGACR
ncbi:hypothetical protein [Crinalium epipsammum]|nr:hypothetical protein [Crinalium epipsammum]